MADSKVMLVITRKVGERLIIGGNIVIEVMGVSGGQVRLGIDAPKDVTILREELTERPRKHQDDTP